MLNTFPRAKINHLVFLAMAAAAGGMSTTTKIIAGVVGAVAVGAVVADAQSGGSGDNDTYASDDDWDDDWNWDDDWWFDPGPGAPTIAETHELIAHDSSATGGEGVHVTILDTGVNVAHEVFDDGRYLADKSFSFAYAVCDPESEHHNEKTSQRQVCLEGYDDPGRTLHDHGTQVGSIAVGGTLNGQTYGVAPEAYFSSMEVLYDLQAGHSVWLGWGCITLPRSTGPTS